MTFQKTQNIQNTLEELGALQSWIEHHGGWNTDYRIETVLTHLKVKDKDQIIGTLSGGWRKRVALAKLILQSPDLLLLDEPTNHLDAEITEWLEGYLREYPGALMLITHDRFFLDKVATGILSFEDDGEVVFYEGNYEIYKSLKAQRIKHIIKEVAPAEVQVQEEKMPDKAGEEKKGLSYKERLELENIEKSIGQLEIRKGEIEAILMNPADFANNPEKLKDIGEEFSLIEISLARQMERWEELEMKK